MNQVLSRTSVRALAFLFAVCILVFTQPIESKEIGSLPSAVANNAVASAKTDSGWNIYSFNGLTTNKDWQSVTNAAYVFNLKSGTSQTINSVPFKQGRLASIAVSVNNQIYLFGGYTVAKDHQEKSMSDVYLFNPLDESFTLFSQMPIPVDDTVALVYLDRYIYLISGWHDVGNVTDVQVLDTQENKWFFATPYPGESVFGHAGGMVGNKMVIADGVKVSGVIDNKRQFAMSPASYLGTIDETDFTKINWQRLPPHPGSAKYRMAAVGSTAQQKIIFAGGSDNPYNFNGIGYNGKPSKAFASVFAWDFTHESWINLPDLDMPSMDHRGLLEINQEFFLAGGMLNNQNVTAKIRRISLDKKN